MSPPMWRAVCTQRRSDRSQRRTEPATPRTLSVRHQKRGPLLGLWGLGSLLGGIATTRLGGGAGGQRGLILLLAALALTHGALILTTGSTLAIAVVITLAGATIAPTVSSIYAMVDAAAPAGTRTEAYSWQLTAALVGGSVGNGVAGALAQSSGAAAAFVLVAAVGALAVLTALLRSHSLANATQAPNRAASPARGDQAEDPSHPSMETGIDAHQRRSEHRTVRRDSRTVAADGSGCLASADDTP